MEFQRMHSLIQAGTKVGKCVEAWLLSDPVKK